MERAIEYAREEVDAGTSGTYTGLVFSFVRDPAKRGSSSSDSPSTSSVSGAEKPTSRGCSTGASPR